MSLNFDFSRVRDHTRVTTNPLHPDQWHPVAEGLVWLSLGCGFREITAENHNKVAARVLAFQKASEPYLYVVRDGKRENVLITARDVQRFIGMTTNAGTLTDAQFERKLGKMAVDNGRWLDTQSTPTALSIMGEYEEKEGVLA